MMRRPATIMPCTRVEAERVWRAGAPPLRSTSGASLELGGGADSAASRAEAGAGGLRNGEGVAPVAGDDPDSATAGVVAPQRGQLEASGETWFPHARHKTNAMTSLQPQREAPATRFTCEPQLPQGWSMWTSPDGSRRTCGRLGYRQDGRTRRWPGGWA